MRGLPESHLRDFADCVVRATPSHDLSWPSAGALARIACCGQPRSASRAAQPSSSAARAVFFAIGSWTAYGHAAGYIQPLRELLLAATCNRRLGQQDDASLM